ncbi:DUF982 domain-containing protein [Shinella sumterensis]|uniref:DUF982 domain-containing protein n=1 Tax=Shinella sumterensis TaxID=1967501 RepID=UPI0014311109|nr:DUF982 domain-containing protein [Shinella sumterensis]MCD1266092.1 DUF982 domain-containing protein [Shinella sumterensis]
MTFETAKLGQYRTISSTAEAAHILLSQWPNATGKAYAEACDVCLAVLGGREPPDAARQAFLLAADEADVFIRNG